MANAKAIKASKENRKNGKNDNKKGSRSDDPSKFENYYKYQVYIDNIHSHQVLAINRAENFKVCLMFDVYSFVSDCRILT